MYLFNFTPRSFRSISWIAGLAAILLTAGCEDDDTDDNLVTFRNIALTGANEVPAVTTSGSGTFDGTYNRTTKVLNYTLKWTLGDPTATTVNMHFHGPAELTESKPVRIPITGFPTGSTNQSFSGSTAALDATQEEELLNGKWYVNIHSSTYPPGELRGQLVR
jgi:hypothetical protein